MSKTLLRGHRRFLEAHGEEERAYLQALGREGQRPRALFVGCADSRIIPEQLMQARPGELFVVRNVANQVPPHEDLDASVGAAIEYAVGSLRVRHIVVCGHHGCGGAQAALGGLDALRGLPNLIEWLRPLERVAARVKDSRVSPDRALRTVVEENVIEQLHNLKTFPLVAAAVEKGELKIHGWTFDLVALALEAYDGDQDAWIPAERIDARASTYEAID